MAIVDLPGGMRVWRAVRLAAARRPRPATPVVTVDADHHADLYRLVLDAASQLDMAPPKLVGLVGTARVRMHRRTLAVGLPLVYGLSTDQLRAVVAHELALPRTPYRRLVRRLLALRADSGGGFDVPTQRLYDAVEQVRDAAAVQAMGGGFAAVEDAAVAVCRADTLEDRFGAFVAASGTCRLGGDRYGIVDLHAGWRHLVRRTGLDKGPAHRDHPGLAVELSGITEAAASADGVAVDGLNPDEEQRLAEEALGETPAAWCRFADLPPEVYAGEVEQSARRLVEAVEAVLGRPPDDRDELAYTLLYRAGDVRRAKAAGTVELAEPPPWLGAAYLATVVEYTLLRRGWRREHPVVSRVLVAADGRSTVDLAELVAEPEELRRYLNAASGTAA
jgi:hypothetical protein